MRRVPLSLILLALLLLTLGGDQAAAFEPANEPVRGAKAPLVYIVHSYNPEYSWTQAISKGIRDSLGGRATVETFYLDAKRDQDPESLRQKSLALLERIEDAKPRLVIAADDTVQSSLVQPHLKGRDAPQVIFCGINAPPSVYGYPARNVSGVHERWHLRQGFELMKLITPKAKRLVFLTDGSDSSSQVLQALKEERRLHGPFALRVTAEQVETFQQWQAKVRASQARAEALAFGVYHSLRDENTGKTVPPETVNAWTEKTNKRPTLGFVDYVLEHGQLCGVLESGHEQGALAGAMARTVLERGVAAGTLPVRVNQKGLVMVNLKTAERLGIMIPFAIIEAADVVVK